MLSEQLPQLTITDLCNEAASFSRNESNHAEPSIYGVTDGKAVGTYVEHKFKDSLVGRYTYTHGNSAAGIDFPDLNIDVKVTSIRQPQSSCPFKSARQKVYGLGYSVLLFVYEKMDDPQTRTSQLRILHTIFIDESRTADYQTTKGIHDILARHGNVDDIIGFMIDRFFPVDDIQAQRLAEEIIANPPGLGYLTISNALQWRLQYSRVIAQANLVEGIVRIA